MMTISKSESRELRAKLIRLGADQMLASLSRQRDEVLKFLKMESVRSKNGHVTAERNKEKVDKVMAVVKKVKDKRKRKTKRRWSPEQKAKFIATMKRKRQEAED